MTERIVKIMKDWRRGRLSIADLCEQLEEAVWDEEMSYKDAFYAMTMVADGLHHKVLGEVTNNDEM